MFRGQKWVLRVKNTLESDPYSAHNLYSCFYLRASFSVTYARISIRIEALKLPKSERCSKPIKRRIQHQNAIDNVLNVLSS